ncbi:MAG: ATP phosphoribosyltransferase [Candidatus Dormibacteria bacterium]
MAVPSGALLADSLRLLRRAKVARLSPEDLGRRLMVEQDGLRLFLVRPTDVPAYVDYGAADLGLVGKDTLWEHPGDRYELADLGYGPCRLVMAVPDQSRVRGRRTWPPFLRVGTKYQARATRFFADEAQVVELVRLHGSVELAPQVGMVDAIVDVTASGRTLRENGLRVVSEIEASTARLVGNPASLKTRTIEVQALAAALRRAAPGTP